MRDREKSGNDTPEPSEIGLKTPSGDEAVRARLEMSKEGKRGCAETAQSGSVKGREIVKTEGAWGDSFADWMETFSFPISTAKSRPAGVPALSHRAAGERSIDPDTPR